MTKMMMKNKILAIALAAGLGLTMASGQALAVEKRAWLVHKLSKAQLKKAGEGWKAEIKRIMSRVPKGSVIQIPAFRAPSLCDFSKSVVYFKDGAGRDTMMCAYIGYMRDSIK